MGDQDGGTGTEVIVAVVFKGSEDAGGRLGEHSGDEGKAVPLGLHTTYRRNWASAMLKQASGLVVQKSGS